MAGSMGTGYWPVMLLRVLVGLGSILSSMEVWGQGDAYVKRHLPRGRTADNLRVHRVAHLTAYLEGHAAELGVLPEDVAELELITSHTDRHNAVTHYYFRQLLHGIEVFRGRAAAAVDRSGRILNLSGYLLRDGVRRLNTLTPDLTHLDALRRAAELTGRTLHGSAPQVVDEQGDMPLRTIFSDPTLSRHVIPILLKIAPTRDNSLRLAWSVTLYLPDGSDGFERLVDAVTGEELAYESFVAHGTPQYSVLPSRRRGDPSVGPVESPAHGSQVEVTDAVLPTADPIASPAGWLDMVANECGVTVGNNTDVNEGGVYPPASPICDFRFPPSVTLAYLDSGPPLSAYQDPALVNLFYNTKGLRQNNFYFCLKVSRPLPPMSNAWWTWPTSTS